MRTYAKKGFRILTFIVSSWIFISLIIAATIKYANTRITGITMTLFAAFMLVQCTFIVFLFTIWLQNKLKGRRI